MSAGAFSQDDFNANDDWGKQVVKRHLLRLGLEVLTPRDKYAIDLAARDKATNKVARYEVEVKHNYPWTSHQDFPFPTVSFLARKHKYTDREFWYCVVCRETEAIIVAKSTDIFKPENKVTKSVSARSRQGNDEFYELSKEQCIFVDSLDFTATGKKGEQLWSAHMTAHGYAIQTAPDTKFYDWDIKATKGPKTITFEVKYDEKAMYWAAKRNTPDKPNLYIEYRNTRANEDSGIMASKADYYVYIIAPDNVAHVFKRDELLSHLLTSSYRTTGNSTYGDDNAEGWIPPLHELVTHTSYVKSVWV